MSSNLPKGLLELNIFVLLTLEFKLLICNLGRQDQELRVWLFVCLHNVEANKQRSHFIRFLL